MSKLYKNTPRLSLEDPDKHVERPLHDDARRDAATTAVPVSRKATDTHIERGEAGASQGVEDAQKWQSHRDAYHRSNDEATKLKDRELSGHFEVLARAYRRQRWPGEAKGYGGRERLGLRSASGQVAAHCRRRCAECACSPCDGSWRWQDATTGYAERC